MKQSKDPKALIFREARREDILEMKFIRDNVKENMLVSLKIEVKDYEQAMFEDGKGWVCIFEGRVAGFACGRLKQKDVWALFVNSDFESMGIGNRLMQILENWMFENGCEEIKLSTEAGTRAERLYRNRGWVEYAVLANKEIGFILQKPKIFS